MDELTDRCAFAMDDGKDRRVERIAVGQGEAGEGRRAPSVAPGIDGIVADPARREDEAHRPEAAAPQMRAADAFHGDVPAHRVERNPEARALPAFYAIVGLVLVPR